MSAFIVEDQKVCNLVYSLTRLRALDRDYLLRPFTALGYDLGRFAEVQRLALDLHVLNCDAVGQRYSEASEADRRPSNFRFGAPNLMSPVQLYKSIQCLHYQCSEGNIPENPLYAALETVQHRLAANIVHNLPEYNAAAWA